MTTNSPSERTKHDVVRTTRFGGLEGRTFPAGHALHFDGTDYFVLKLWFLYDRTYFICRNQASADQYTVYGRKVQEEGVPVRFLNPVGFAHTNEQKTHLEVVLPDLPRR